MKLIILAQPKTASTSLLQAISDLSGLPCKQHFIARGSPKLVRLVIGLINKVATRLSDSLRIKEFGTVKLRDAFPAKSYSALSMLHSDVSDICSDVSAEDLFFTPICKQHLPPTEGNIRLLSSVPKIILIRSVDETIEAYRRVPSLSAELKTKLRDEEFCQKLKEELNAWQKGWLELAKNNANILIVSKDEAVKEPVKVLKKIAKIIGNGGFAVPEGYQLPKKRYYRPHKSS